MSPRRRRSYQRGILAEYVACAWLILKGYRLVAMRYKTPVGEIDLVMRRGKTLAILEVKARKQLADAALAIHHENQSRVMRATQYFSVSEPRYAHLQVRFDAVLIAWYKWPRHVPHAFGA